MIPDPVPLSRGTFGERTMRDEIFSDHEKRRLKTAPAQHVEHQWRRLRIGAVIEAERQVEHRARSIWKRSASHSAVMPGLVPGIHALLY
jgi:hypothetical protein